MPGGSVGKIRRREFFSVDSFTLTNTFGPEYRMLIIGAGQLSEYLSTMAKFSGFAVTLCDPRIEHRSAWAVPGVAISTEMPDDAVLAFRPDRRSCVVALTHDPKLDDLALLEALDKDKTYLIYCRTGRRSAGARDIMAELGFREVYNRCFINAIIS